MTSVEFCYWLQGMFELQNPKSLDKEQVDCIRKHLAMVFKHEIDALYQDQAELNKIHGPSGGDFLIRC